MENNATDMKTQFVSLVEDSAFVDAIQQMQDFYSEMNPDVDMCYDYVCEIAGISSFVADDKAWDMFYNAWEILAA
jgi:hypothetical protein